MLPVASVRDLGVSLDADALACDEYSEIVVCSVLRYAACDVLLHRYT